MVVTTWSHVDEFVRAEAETDIWAGDAPRPTLVVFEGEMTTLVAHAPSSSPGASLRGIVELSTLARVIRADRFVLSAPLPSAETDEEFSVAAIASRPFLVVARASRGLRRARVRVEAVPYGRNDCGAPVWKRGRRVQLRRGRALRRLLEVSLRGPEGTKLPAPETFAAYLLSTGYRIAAADGWARRYGLDSAE
jgi:hypothetical protein